MRAAPDKLPALAFFVCIGFSSSDKSGEKQSGLTLLLLLLLLQLQVHPLLLLSALAAKPIERKRVSKQALCSISDSIVLGAALDRERSCLADRHSSLLPVSHRMERLAQHSMRRGNIGSFQTHRQTEESARERLYPALVDLVESFLDHEDRERVRRRRDAHSPDDPLLGIQQANVLARHRIGDHLALDTELSVDQQNCVRSVLVGYCNGVGYQVIAGPTPQDTTRTSASSEK